MKFKEWLETDLSSRGRVVRWLCNIVLLFPIEAYMEQAWNAALKYGERTVPQHQQGEICPHCKGRGYGVAADFSIRKGNCLPCSGTGRLPPVR